MTSLPNDSTGFSVGPTITQIEYQTGLPRRLLPDSCRRVSTDARSPLTTANAAVLLLLTVPVAAAVSGCAVCCTGPLQLQAAAGAVLCWHSSASCTSGLASLLQAACPLQDATPPGRPSLKLTSLLRAACARASATAMARVRAITPVMGRAVCLMPCGGNGLMALSSHLLQRCQVHGWGSS
eukprot:GHUV01015204.1.p1 GENE.GHUV01015204.1~~GHUV01015204.1.p1  ORF type:complete len:181 (-),score=37.88 GHUV01015204.1:1374-1916(-)